MTDPTFAPWTEDQAQHLYGLFYDQIGLCGCGHPAAAVALIRRLLDLAPFHDHPAETTAVFHGDPGVEHLTLSILDQVGLTEHGGSLQGSWLTDKGEAVRRLMALAGPGRLDDVLDSTGLPHGGEPCPGGCWAAWKDGP